MKAECFILIIAHVALLKAGPNGLWLRRPIKSGHKKPSSLDKAFKCLYFSVEVVRNAPHKLGVKNIDRA